MQRDFTRRDHPGNLGRVSGSGLVIMGPSKGDPIVWYWVTQHPQVVRELTVSQRTSGFGASQY